MESLLFLRFPKVTFIDLRIFWPKFNFNDVINRFCDVTTWAFYDLDILWFSIKKQTYEQNLNRQWRHRKKDYFSNI